MVSSRNPSLKKEGKKGYNKPLAKRCDTLCSKLKKLSYGTTNQKPHAVDSTDRSVDLVGCSDCRLDPRLASVTGKVAIMQLSKEAKRASWVLDLIT